MISKYNKRKFIWLCDTIVSIVLLDLQFVMSSNRRFVNHLIEGSTSTSNSRVIVSPRRYSSTSSSDRTKSSLTSICLLTVILLLFIGFYWFLTSHLVDHIDISIAKDAKVFLRKEMDLFLPDFSVKSTSTVNNNNNNDSNYNKRRKKRYAYAITITKDGFFQDGAAVLAYSIMKYSYNASYEISFIAFVHPSVQTSRPGLTRLGFHVIEVPIPINRTAIQYEFLREKIDKNGCCGSAELIKLTSYRLLQYERVIHLDADVIFLNPIDELFAMNYSLIYTTDPNMATFKGVDKMPVQGGFIVLKPSEEDYRRIIHTEMTTEFKKNHGWNSSHIGWFWGGMTVQGILPYYYNRITTPGRSFIVDRCYYNTMADTPPCSVQTLEQLKSAHFTVCQKPWGCFKQLETRLCNDLHSRWLALRAEAEKFYGIESRPTCKSWGHKSYVVMDLEHAKMPDRESPSYFLRQNVVPDDSPSRFDPTEESMYIREEYNR